MPGNTRTLTRQELIMNAAREGEFALFKKLNGLEKNYEALMTFAGQGEYGYLHWLLVTYQYTVEDINNALAAARGAGYTAPPEYELFFNIMRLLLAVNSQDLDGIHASLNTSISVINCVSYIDTTQMIPFNAIAVLARIPDDEYPDTEIIQILMSNLDQVATRSDLRKVLYAAVYFANKDIIDILMRKIRQSGLPDLRGPELGFIGSIALRRLVEIEDNHLIHPLVDRRTIAINQFDAALHVMMTMGVSVHSRVYGEMYRHAVANEYEQATEKLRAYGEPLAPKLSKKEQKERDAFVW